MEPHRTALSRCLLAGFGEQAGSRHVGLVRESCSLGNGLLRTARVALELAEVNERCLAQHLTCELRRLDGLEALPGDVVDRYGHAQLV
jgi:hypothetical protein